MCSVSLMGLSAFRSNSNTSCVVSVNLGVCVPFHLLYEERKRLEQG